MNAVKAIRWGMIGCGDVTELKSGPAFNKVPFSSLVAVMSRNMKRAKDYASRHHVPFYYDDTNRLINDPQVNAVYIATPPSSHEEYALAAITAGKSVYVEKPVSLDHLSALRMAEVAEKQSIKLVVAHYRREQPMFKKIKQLLTDKEIGEVRSIQMEFFKASLSKEEMAVPKTSWRINAQISGGGLFHDLAPHQLDLMLYFFGRPLKAYGHSSNLAKLYEADDIVSGQIQFKSGATFTGNWCFCAPDDAERDICEIIGSEGIIRFSIFGEPQISITRKESTKILKFDPLQHVQQPMIESVIKYFLGDGLNPCSGWEGAEVMKLMDTFTGK